MSGIAGIYNSDGRPVDPAVIKRMIAAMRHRGPDDANHWIGDAIGAGHCMLYTTPESLRERQPLLDETGDLCLTMDGRVDNCEELRAALTSERIRLRDDTDAELVLRAYQCWGDECPTKILGDFAFVIWDGRKHQLFCVRDPIGNKPFVYYWDGKTFIWGSELHQLFEEPTVPRKPNEGMIAEHLAANITNTEETLYENVLRLPPAHSLLIRGRRLTKRRYWQIDQGKEIRYGTDDQYAEHFMHVFEQSVHCCLRCHAPVGAYLSGGLDSSSVVCVIQSMYCRGLAENKGFETFSMLYPGLACDERNYISAVVEQWDLSANYLDLQKPSELFLKKQAQFYKDVCDSPNGAQLDPIKALAREKGFRVLLTGFGGDERLGGTLYYLADVIRGGKIAEFRRALHVQGLRLSRKRDLLKVLRYGVEPLMPSFLRRGLRLLKRRPSVDWIDSDFVGRVGLQDRLRRDANAGQLVGTAKMKLQTFFNNGGQLHGMEMEDRSASFFGIEQRHPFRDRRMVELCFALPEDQRLRKDQKFVLRQAMRDHLPQTVRQRRDKAEFSETLVRAIDALGGEKFFEHPYLEGVGCVNATRIRAMYEEMKRLRALDDENYMLYVWPLWAVCALDLWYRASFVDATSLEYSHSFGGQSFRQSRNVAPLKLA